MSGGTDGPDRQDDELHRLNALDAAVRTLLNRWSGATGSTPVDLVPERSRVVQEFTAGRTATPRFSYPEQPFDVQQWRTEVAEVKTLARLDTPWDVRVRELLDRHVGEVEAVRNREAAAITEYTESVHGRPTPLLLDVAQTLLDDLPREAEPEPSLGPEDAAARMRLALDVLRLPDWSVVVKPSMQARMSVTPGKRRVNVSGDATFDAVGVDRLITHEIGTHVLRTAQARAQPLRLLARPLGVSEPTEEGLAVHNEARIGVLSPADLRRYALRVVAAQLSLELPFAAVVQELLPHLDVRSAVEIVIRAKRGFADPGLPGAHLKDISYLAGYLEVSAHLRDRPRDFSLLMSVKQPLAALPLLHGAEEIGWLRRWPHPVGHDPRLPAADLDPAPTRHPDVVQGLLDRTAVGVVPLLRSLPTDPPPSE